VVRKLKVKIDSHVREYDEKSKLSELGYSASIADVDNSRSQTVFLAVVSQDQWSTIVMITSIYGSVADSFSHHVSYQHPKVVLIS